MIGQPHAETGGQNQGLPVSDRGLNYPTGMALAPDGGLLLADTVNSRVLLYSPMPAETNASAMAVIGQPNLQTSAPVISREGLNLPASVAAGAGKIAVADRASHRVLIYTDPLQTGQSGISAAVVIGQGGFESAVSTCDANGLDRPGAVTITPDGKLIVADTFNHRILVWDPIPEGGAPVPPPSLVLGQADADHCYSNDDDQMNGPDLDANGNPIATARTLSTPDDVWSDGKRLVVADRGNHRVLIWDTGTFPSTNFQPANVVLGHSSFSNTSENSEHDAEGSLPAPTARTLALPMGVHSDGKSLAVADAKNNRVLIWNTFPKISFERADVVLGHPGFEQRVQNDQNGDTLPDGPTSQIMYSPFRVLFSSDDLIVSDGLHHRVLVFRRQ